MISTDFKRKVVHGGFFSATSGPITLNKIEFQDVNSDPNGKKNTTDKDAGEKDKSLLQITKDGIYVLQLEITSSEAFNASVDIKFKGKHGLLTAKDLPMLHVS